MGTASESGPRTTMVGMISGPATEHVESLWGGCVAMPWQCTKEGTGAVGADGLAGRCSLTVVGSTGERWGEGGKPASTVSQWKGLWYILLVALSSREKLDPGLFV